jgi:hypothetical protein
MCHRKCFSTRDMGCSSARSRSQDTIEAQSQGFPSALKSRARLTLHPAGTLTRLFANVLRLWGVSVGKRSSLQSGVADACR